MPCETLQSRHLNIVKSIKVNYKAWNHPVEYPSMEYKFDVHKFNVGMFNIIVTCGHSDSEKDITQLLWAENNEPLYMSDD